MSINEHNTRALFIDPVLKLSGWKDSQILREYYFTDGAITVHGHNVGREQAKRADYLLFHKGNDFPLAVIEAKRLGSYSGKGLQQAIDYAQILGAPFAYSANGQDFTEHDFTTGLERMITPENFPSRRTLNCGNVGSGTKAFHTKKST